MCTVCYLWFISCSLLVTNANTLIDLQEAQKFMEQLDYDYSAAAADAAAAPQRSAADLLWYDYGGGGGGGGGGGYYGGGVSPAAAGALPAVLISSEKRGDTTQSSTGGMWFGPRLGRRKRRGGSAYSNNGVVLQPMDGNAIGPAVPQDAAVQAMAAVTTAAEQAVVSDMINSAPWVLVPIMENSLYNQLQIKQSSRNGRSSAENGDDASSPSSSRHTARSPPFSPPFSPRLGRQVAGPQPQVPRLGREALLFRRDARSASYQQNAAAALLRGGRQLQRLQRGAQAAATVSAAAQRHAA